MTRAVLHASGHTKEFFGMKGSLADKARSRPAFSPVLTFALAGGRVISLLGIDPIKALVITAIINGIVAPPMLALIALLAATRRSWRTRPTARSAIRCSGSPPV
jgi:Mn2+/Fe2+ NRAMP family transporter